MIIILNGLVLQLSGKYFHKDSLEVKLTHVGLVPEFECFDKCSLGWDYLMQKSLLELLNEGKGLPV